MHIDRQAARRYFATEERADDHLLGTLRILDGMHANADRQIVGTAVLERLHGIGFVGLDCDDGTLGTGGSQQVTYAEENVAGLLEHDPMIGGQIRLALDAVDDDRIDRLALGWSKLDVRRECCTTEPDDAGTLDSRDDVVRHSRLDVTRIAVIDDLRGRWKGL